MVRRTPTPPFWTAATDDGLCPACTVLHLLSVLLGVELQLTAEGAEGGLLPSAAVERVELESMEDCYNSELSCDQVIY